MYGVGVVMTSPAKPSSLGVAKGEECPAHWTPRGDGMEVREGDKVSFDTEDDRRGKGK
jgi:hypothetical protein